MLIPALASAKLLGGERQFADTLVGSRGFSDSAIFPPLMQDETMDTEHLDNLVAIVYRGLGRSLSQAVYLLKEAKVP